jgi:tight adherence protein B
LPLLRFFLARTSFSNRWQLDLDRAGLQLKVSEYVLIRLLFAVVFAFAALLLLRFSTAGFLAFGICAIVGYMAPAFYVGLRKARRRDAISAQLVEMLEMLSNSLRSGFAFVQAVELAARQLKPPIKDELEAFLSDTSLGAKTEDALHALADRTASVDIELMVTTILVQRTSGGNLSEVLDNVAATIRERERLQGDIRALTAQQRFTGLVLSVYPILLGLLFVALAPDIWKVLWEKEGGRILLAVAAGLQLLGMLSIRRILKLEV